MRLYYIVISFFIGTAIAANWSPEDYEIFKLRDKIIEDLGKETTFYSWLGLEKGPKSSLEEITKAYRKLTRKLHPDKFHSAKKSIRKKAEERFQRLSLVGNILRDQSLKRRYDYFLNKGFPKLIGSGYLYSRFRPGFFLTLAFLYILVGAFHFISLKISRNQDYKRIVDLKEQLKSRAWNGSLIPPSDGSDRKVVHPTTGKEFIIYHNGDVNLVETDDNGNLVHHPLNENDINRNVGFRDTLFYRGPVAAYNSSLGRAFGQIQPPKPPKSSTEPQPEKPKPKKKNKGEKIELPNGKVIYGRKRK